jgi:hypothetical protein
MLTMRIRTVTHLCQLLLVIISNCGRGTSAKDDDSRLTPRANPNVPDFWYLQILPDSAYVTHPVTELQYLAEIGMAKNDMINKSAATEWCRKVVGS